MKCIFIIVAALFCCSPSSAQIKRPNSTAKRYFIDGHLPQVANCTVYLVHQIYTNSQLTTDSTKADDYGRFRFTGHVDEPLIGEITVNKPLPKMYFSLENSVISITADSVHTIKVQGSKENDALKQAMQMTDSPLFTQVREHADVDLQSALNKNDTTAISAARLHRDTVWQQIKTAVVGFVNRYPSYTIAVRAVALLM